MNIFNCSTPSKIGLSNRHYNLGEYGIFSYLPDLYKIIRSVTWMQKEPDLLYKWINIWFPTGSTNINHPLVSHLIGSFAIIYRYKPVKSHRSYSNSSSAKITWIVTGVQLCPKQTLQYYFQFCSPTSCDKVQTYLEIFPTTIVFFTLNLAARPSPSHDSLSPASTSFWARSFDKNKYSRHQWIQPLIFRHSA